MLQYQRDQRMFNEVSNSIPFVVMFIVCEHEWEIEINGVAKDKLDYIDYAGEFSCSLFVVLH